MNIHLPRCSLLLLNIAWNFGTGWVNSFRSKGILQNRKGYYYEVFDNTEICYTQCDTPTSPPHPSIKV